MHWAVSLIQYWQWDWLILCGELTVTQALSLDDCAFDPFPLFDDRFSRAEVGLAGLTLFRLSR